MKSAGISAVTFSSAGEFLEAANDSQVDCAVTDLRMPDVDGIKLQQALAQIVPHLAIVFVTGHGDVPAGIKAMKGGAVDFLEKPVDDDALLDAVRRAAERSREARASRAGVRRPPAPLRAADAARAPGVPADHLGLTQQAGGRQLGTGEKTIKVQRARVMDKMEAASLAELVRMAFSITTDSPNVTSSVVRMLRSSEAWITVRCST